MLKLLYVLLLIKGFHLILPFEFVSFLFFLNDYTRVLTMHGSMEMVDKGDFLDRVNLGRIIIDYSSIHWT